MVDQIQTDVTKLYVGDLHASVTEEKLHEILSTSTEFKGLVFYTNENYLNYARVEYSTPAAGMFLFLLTFLFVNFVCTRS